METILLYSLGIVLALGVAIGLASIAATVVIWGFGLILGAIGYTFLGILKAIVWFLNLFIPIRKSNDE